MKTQEENMDARRKRVRRFYVTGEGLKPTKNGKHVATMTQETAARFIEIWYTATSRKEVADKFGVAEATASAYASRLRKAGVELPRFHVGRPPLLPLEVDALNERVGALNVDEQRKLAKILETVKAAEQQKLPKKTKASKNRVTSAYPRSFRLDAATLKRISILHEVDQLQLEANARLVAAEAGRKPKKVRATAANVLRKAVRRLFRAYERKMETGK